MKLLKYEDMSFIKRPSQLLATLALILIFVTIYDVLTPPKQSAQSINNDLPQVYKDRQSHIQSVCEEHHDRFVNDYKRFQPRLSFHSVITKVDLFKSRTSSPFLWCRVPKASSQSWNDLFMGIWYKKDTQYIPGRQQMILRRKWTIQTKTEEMLYGTNDRLFSFMVARHPFERILSAYRDKFFLNLDYSHDVFERNKVQRFYKLYGREILKKYRKTQPTEPKYKNAPTFREFIDYLVDLPLRRLDSHWLPTYFQCMPCHIKYDILGRIDTMPEDSREILKRIGVKKQLPFAHVTQGKTSDQTVENFCAELDTATLDRLYKLYEMDFLLFNFSPDRFYKLVQS